MRMPLRPELIVTTALKRRILRTGLDVLSALRADRWLAAVGRWRGVVLTLHRVRQPGADPFQPNAHLEITPAFLDEVILRLRRQGVRLVDLDEAADRMKARSAERFAVLTFDDGYRDNRDVALPLLRDGGVPFTVFIATGMIDGTASVWWLTLEDVLRRAARITLPVDGRPVTIAASSLAEKRRAFQVAGRLLGRLGEHERAFAVRRLAAEHGVDIPALLRREMMTWAEVRELAAAPGVTIGGHTVDHPSLAKLDDDEARREIVGGLDRIEAMTGHRPRHFSYPFGGARDVSRRDVELVRALGLDVAVTTSVGMLREGRAVPAAWPRLSLNGNFQHGRDFEILVSGVPLLSGLQPRSALAGA